MEILGGPLFGIAGAGESHGPAVTTIVFGCPPGLWVSRAQVQRFLDRRRPGRNRLGTPRREADQVLFLSGLYAEDYERLTAGPEVRIRAEEGERAARTYEEGYTTGEPIAALVFSTSGRPAEYAQFLGPRGAVRPGHADLVKHYKSRGFADVRGGGRSSYRSTISDVIGGSIARIFLEREFGTAILSSICQVGPLRARERLADRLEEMRKASGSRLAPDQIAEVESRMESAEIHTLDPVFAGNAARLIDEVRRQRDSVGAAIEVVAVNVPPLIGEPLYQSLKLRLMGSLGGLHAAQYCEIGAGADAVSRRGSENNDPIRRTGYQSNHHGGLLGGITTGMPLVCRVGFKPTSTIGLPQDAVRKDLEEIEFTLEKGRHDPCVGIRAGVALESRMALELMNAVLMQQARAVDPGIFELFPPGETP